MRVVPDDLRDLVRRTDPGADHFLYGAEVQWNGGGRGRGVAQSGSPSFGGTPRLFG